MAALAGKCIHKFKLNSFMTRVKVFLVCNSCIQAESSGDKTDLLKLNY
jgi:hypothetical protein